MAPLSMEFSKQEHWSGMPFLPAKDLPYPGTEPASPASVDGFFTIAPPGKLLPLVLKVKILSLKSPASGIAAAGGGGGGPGRAPGSAGCFPRFMPPFCHFLCNLKKIA